MLPPSSFCINLRRCPFDENIVPHIDSPGQRIISLRICSSHYWCGCCFPRYILIWLKVKILVDPSRRTPEWFLLRVFIIRLELDSLAKSSPTSISKYCTSDVFWDFPKKRAQSGKASTNNSDARLDSRPDDNICVCPWRRENKWALILNKTS